MIAYSASLKAVGGARTGIAPANLLDIQDVNGRTYYLSDRPIIAPTVISGFVPPEITLPQAIPPGQGVAWAFARNATAASGWLGTAVAPADSAGNITAGTMAIGAQGPATTASSIQFSNFAMPQLPSGAVLQSAFGVCVISGFGDTVTTSGGFSFTDADLPGQFTTPLVATPSAIQAWTPVFSLRNTVPPVSGFNGSVFIGPYDAAYKISGIAVAIYYSVPNVYIPGSFTPGVAGSSIAPYKPWLLSVPQISFHRSLQTDVGNFVIQNLSGDTYSRDMEKNLRASALEGAFFAYRLWQPDAQAAWLEVHGLLTVGDVGVDTLTLKGAQTINPAQEDTPLEIYCETCQLNWGQARCGATGPTECQYSYQTCQVVERIMVVLNNYEKNYGETTANTALKVINRRRRI